MRVRPGEVPRRLHGDGGSAIVEAAFLTPVLMFLLLGVFESAFVFLDYLTAGNAMRAGLRTGAIAGHQWDADYKILQSIHKASTALKSGDLQMVVVFEAKDQNSTVPAGCAAGTPSAATPMCNVYSGAQLTAPLSDTSVFGCGAAADHYYCPDENNRRTVINPPKGPLGWFGVYIEVKHTYVTKLFGSSITIKAWSVGRFEPESLN